MLVCFVWLNVWHKKLAALLHVAILWKEVVAPPSSVRIAHKTIATLTPTFRPIVAPMVDLSLAP